MVKSKKDDIKFWTQLIIISILVAALVAGFLMQLIATEAFTGVVSTAITYYFMDKKNTKELDATIEALRVERKMVVLEDECEKV